MVRRNNSLLKNSETTQRWQRCFLTKLFGSSNVLNLACGHILEKFQNIKYDWFWTWMDLITLWHDDSCFVKEIGGIFNAMLLQHYLYWNTSFYCPRTSMPGFTLGRRQDCCINGCAQWHCSPFFKMSTVPKPGNLPLVTSQTKEVVFLRPMHAISKFSLKANISFSHYSII